MNNRIFTYNLPYKYLKYTYALFVVLLYCGSSLAQEGAQSIPQNIFYQSAMDLMDKGLYLEAQKMWEQYLVVDSESDWAADAAYYNAFCALEMKQADADSKLAYFIHHFPFHPQAITAYYVWGKKYFEEENYDKTVLYLGKYALKKVDFQKRLEVKHMMGVAFFERGDYELAAPYFEELKSGFNEYSAIASYYSSYLAVQNKDFQLALDDARAAERQDESGSLKYKTPVVISYSLYGLGEYESLVSYASPLLDTTAQDELVNYQQLVDIYQLTGDASYRIEDFDKAIVYLGQAFGMKSQKLTPENYYQMGYTYFKTEDLKTSIEYLKDIALKDNEMGQYACYYLAIAYTKLKEYSSALLAFEQASTMDFNPVIRQQSTTSAAKLYFQTERYSEAIESIEKLLQRYPSDPERSFFEGILVQSYLYSKKYTQTIYFIENQKIKTDKILAIYQQATLNQGLELMNNDQVEEAIQMFEKSLQYKSISSEQAYQTMFWLAEAYMAKKDFLDVESMQQSVQVKAIPLYEEYLKLYDEKEDSLALRCLYGLGYAHYELDEFDLAIPYFENYIKGIELTKPRLFYNDATLRLADCYQGSEDYTKAIQLYQKAIDQKAAQSDYAYYQMALCHLSDDKNERAENALNKLVSEFPASPYYGAALYNKAAIHIAGGRFAVGIEELTKLIDNSYTLAIKPFALSERARAYVNIKNYIGAYQDLKQLTDKFPTVPISEQTANNLAEELQPKVEASSWDIIEKNLSVGKQTLDNAIQQQINQARQMYGQKNYKQSINLLNTISNKNPSTFFQDDIQYLLAENYRGLHQNEEALRHYMDLSKKENWFYTENALYKSMVLLVELKNHRQAIDQAYHLGGITQNKEIQLEAWIQIMESYAELNRYDSVIFWAKNILKDKHFSQVQNLARLYRAKSFYIEGRFDEAKADLDLIVGTLSAKLSSEAEFYAASMLYNQHQYKQALEVLMKVVKNYPNEIHWLGESFLLIGKCYDKMKEYFLAKVTIEYAARIIQDTDIKQKAQRELLMLKNNYDR